MTGREGGGIMTGNGGNGIVGDVVSLPLDLLISVSSVSDNSTDSSSNCFNSGSGEGSGEGSDVWGLSMTGIIIFSRPVKIRREARARSTVPPAILCVKSTSPWRTRKSNDPTNRAIQLISLVRETMPLPALTGGGMTSH